MFLIRAALPMKRQKRRKMRYHILGGKIEECIKFQLPESEIGRSFVKIRKSKSTPKKYPRKAGVPAKEPLLNIFYSISMLMHLFLIA